MQGKKIEQFRIRTWKSWLRAVLLFGLAFGTFSCGRVAPLGESAAVHARESVYDRVIRTGTIRASFAVYPPYCIKDPNTGKLSGVMVEMLGEAAARLKLKLEWTEEVGWGTIFEGLNSDRYDIFGAGVWRNSSRGKVGDFSQPLFFNVIKVYGRADETRFTGAFDEINRRDVRLSVMDGAIDDIIGSQDFPSAQKVSVQQLNPVTDMLLNITSHKADVTFAEPGFINQYLAKNPGTLKELCGGKPIRVFANTYAFKLGEPAFKAMLDSCLDEMLNDGTVERILRRYEKNQGEYLRVALPYRLPTGAGNAN